MDRKPISGFTCVKVVSSSKREEHAHLGDWLMDWLDANPQLELVHTEVLQSSDMSHHCLTLVAFAREKS